MAKITVLVCDECATQDGVKHYDLREDGRRASVDLCGLHASALEELLTRAEEAPRRAVRAPRSRARKVTTMDEIEQLKKRVV